MRSAVLAAGFGVGVGVMAILLGVAEIVLDQARAPELVGGGNVVVRLGPDVPARLLLTGAMQSDALRRRVRTAAPSHDARLYLVRDGRSTEVFAHGGIPSLERALGDPETRDAAAWRDTPADVAWTQDTPEKVLRYIDRFHPIPPATEWSRSWAEWLYFNGRGRDRRFYLTFMVGDLREDGLRNAGVRLQLDRSGTLDTFYGSGPISPDAALQAPDLTIGTSSVRLDGLLYRVHLDLTDTAGRRVVGDLSLQASPGKLVPPFEIMGARGWRTGYVVPVMEGRLEGELMVDGQLVSLAGGSGYHDHNWGFWEGVSWQWGQVQQDGLSFLYGRVFPPAGAADPERMPGFVGALGPDGPLGYATDVTIKETDDERGRPQRIEIDARGTSLRLQLRFDVESFVTTQGTIGSNLDFLQMRGRYAVSGRAGGRDIAFTAPGSAETFRGANASSPASSPAFSPRP